MHYVKEIVGYNFQTINDISDNQDFTIQASHTHARKK